MSKKLLKCMEILKVFQRISEVFKEGFMGATGRLKGCFKSVSWMIQAFSASFKGSFKRGSRIFHKSFKEV